MKPSRDEHAIVDLVDVLLPEGAILQADVVVPVGDIPLIRLNLQAALAGMATMTDYGILTDWDREIRQRDPVEFAEQGVGCITLVAPIDLYFTTSTARVIESQSV